ncbi:hypothetical protein C5167_019110 [Papaver somniferum]|uniref:Uncharacterized protein n=1 Tax=Papaver somniferum TaxID=3469 RepID=A0A4Y7IRD0_PAPSO|nr:hypothetical protein C5167_019110 [Papaver somniferum]
MGKLRKWYHQRLLAELSEDDFDKELLRRKMCGERSSELLKELENILEAENELKLRFSELTKEAENLLASRIEVKLRRAALAREIRAAFQVHRAA